MINLFKILILIFTFFLIFKSSFFYIKVNSKILSKSIEIINLIKIIKKSKSNDILLDLDLIMKNGFLILINLFFYTTPFIVIFLLSKNIINNFFINFILSLIPYLYYIKRYKKYQSWISIIIKIKFYMISFQEIKHYRIIYIKD